MCGTSVDTAASSKAPHISVIPAAAAHFDGDADLTLAERSTDNHLTVPGDAADGSIRGTRTVRVVRLDSASAASIDILESAGYTVRQIGHGGLISLDDPRIPHGHLLGYRDPTRI